MTRLFVVEARRLLPIAVLFVMLLVVSVYDGFSNPVAPVTTGPNSVPYKTLTQSALGSQVQMQVVTSLDMWVAMHSAVGANLGEHNFNPETEVAVFLLNCQLRSTAMASEESVVELMVTPRKNSFQVLLFSKDHLPSGDGPKFVLVENEN